MSADIDFVGEKGNAHRKAVLLLRQSLDPHSIYADMARHGDGLTSLQYRDSVGADSSRRVSQCARDAALIMRTDPKTQIEVTLQGDAHRRAGGHKGAVLIRNGDGKMIAFLAYPPGTQGHPANQDVEIRMLSLAGRKVRTLARLLGGRAR